MTRAAAGLGLAGNLSSTTHQQAISTGTADVKTITPPSDASACLIAIATTAARITFDGSVPSSTNGLLFPISVAPIFIPVGRGATIKIASSAAANAAVDVLFLA